MNRYDVTMANPDTWAILNPDDVRVWIAGDRGSRRTAPSLRSRMSDRTVTGGPDECWPWTGSRNARGYGTMRVDGRTLLVPRVVYRLAYGAWPLITRHTCDNPPCANPAHLIDGTKASNAADRDERGRNGFTRRTHCPAGHEYTPANTAVLRRTGKRAGQTYRACRACRAARRTS